MPKPLLTPEVDPVTGCWNWRNHIDKRGYGKAGGKLAHRLMYEKHIGPIPEGMCLDHLCQNKKCVNPQHLEPVTPVENSRRSKNGCCQVNASKTHCKNGHEFTQENTSRSNRGQRVCKKCAVIAAQKYKERQGLREEIVALRAQVRELAEALEVAQDAMDERRSYVSSGEPSTCWQEMKYGKVWDEEDAKVSAALSRCPEKYP